MLDRIFCSTSPAAAAARDASGRIDVCWRCERIIRCLWNVSGADSSRFNEHRAKPTLAYTHTHRQRNTHSRGRVAASARSHVPAWRARVARYRPACSTLGHAGRVLVCEKCLGVFVLLVLFVVERAHFTSTRAHTLWAIAWVYRCARGQARSRFQARWYTRCSMAVAAAFLFILAEAAATIIAAGGSRANTVGIEAKAAGGGAGEDVEKHGPAGGGGGTRKT